MHPIESEQSVSAAHKKMAQIEKHLGKLEIDHETGVITFLVENVTVLRVSHLKQPIPRNAIIDIVALRALTTYIEIKLCRHTYSWCT
jgi:hypothetical protein